jgi:hypothetical protein
MSYRWHHRTGARYPVAVEANPVAVPVETGGDCACHKAADGSLLSTAEQKIKQNPLVAIVGALAVGFLLAKKRAF